METAIVVVHGVSEKRTKKDKPYKSFIDQTGSTWNVFYQKHYSQLEIGKEFEIDFEISEDGEYKNIKDMRFMCVRDVDEHVFTEEKKQSGIMESVAIKEVGCLLCAGTPTVPEDVVEFYWQRVRFHLGMDTPLVEAVKEAGGVVKAQTTPLGMIANAGEFLTKALKEFKMNRPQVEAAIGTKIADLKDFEGAYVFLCEVKKREAEVKS